MIHLTPSLLSEDRAKRIRDWMQHPGASDFIEYLADRAAYHTALAGNALVEDHLVDVEAKNAAEEARRYVEFHALMMQVLAGGEQFEVVKLSPKPLTTSP